MAGVAPSGRVGAPAITAVGMRSPISWALLGLIIDRPSYGYELYKRFERTFGEVLPIRSESHIYRSLDVLELRSLVERGPTVARTARQPKPSYRSTHLGAMAYRGWLEGMAVRQRPLPSAMFACALAALAGEPDIALLILDRCEQWCVDGALATRGVQPAAGSTVGRSLAARLLAEERRLALVSAAPWFRFARREFEELAAARSPEAVSR